MKTSKKKTGNTRIIDIKQISISTKKIFKIIDKKIPENLFDRPLLYEDIGIWNKVPDTGDDVKELLNLAMKEYSNHIERNPLYDVIVSEFIKKYGVHGKCDDVHSFLIEIQNKLISNSTDYKDIQREKSDISPLLKPSILLYYQIAFDEDIINSKKIVINQLNKGIVNIVSRFIPLFDEQKEESNNMLIKELKNWLSNASDQGEFVQVNFSADWNNVQASRSITKRRIVWPSDLSDEIESNNENSLRINQVRLVHDCETNKLLYQDQYGQTIIPIYTGTIPMQLLSLQFQLFNMVVDPWLIKNNHDNRFIEFPKNVKTIRQNNRIEKSNIVYKRAEWIIPKESIPKLKNLSKTEIFKALFEWKTKNELPEEFFITTRCKNDHINILMKKKPFYFSFKNSYTHQHLEVAIKDNDFEGLILSEVFPSIDDGLGTSEGKVHTAEFLTLTKLY
ncbi:hypothetical protein [Bacillus sp. JCM 19041]|uniref:hypothetical protein n=1 Tax=Bacillus sp. JCM 19041 TaxID=1460637 RepID=UPI0006D2719F